MPHAPPKKHDGSSGSPESLQHHPSAADGRSTFVDWKWTAMFSLAALALAVFAFDSQRAFAGRMWDKLTDEWSVRGGVTLTLNASSCPGYTLNSVESSNVGLTAKLDLAGPACNAYGTDIANLTIEVTYETPTRLHVHIYDTAKRQFQVPESVIARPPPPDPSANHADASDLVFNYEPSPFAFWITRRSDPHGFALFDTRPQSLPRTPVPPVIPSDASTALDSFQLVFEDEYLQLTSSLPHGTNIYGLGEVLASSGFRRDVGTNGGEGTVQSFWARDVADPIDENVYGSHPVYLEHRYDEATKGSKSHGVVLMSSAGADTLLLTPPNSPVSLIQYRLISGVLDFYFLSGPEPQSVIEQYGELIGLPTWQPYWGFGFQLCRWGYANISETRDQVAKMREANIPLEVIWNDIDLYHAVRDFTEDPVSFPAEEVRDFIRELASNSQHYIPIVDAAIPKTVNDTDVYDPYTAGTEQRVFITNPDGSEYIGQVWPGYTVFPDWFAKNTTQWWTTALKNWSASGVEFSGIWLDMNEASSFCEGSCGSAANISNTSAPFILPGAPGNPVTGFPEGYDEAVSGPSGNISNDILAHRETTALTKRVVHTPGAGRDLNTPPYAIHNGAGRLSVNTIATNATHATGDVELDVHNLFGLMEERATHEAVLEIIPGKRPFLISRSTFPSSGRWTGHWLGDNFSKWKWMYLSIQGVLQFQLFQIPMVGPDTCGFMGNTDEELCNRWMQLSAFFPFYRNHNVLGALPQEPYRWDSVAAASRTAIAVRYKLLPYWYSLFANSSIRGTPPVRALFFGFPNEPELFGVDRQFLIGRDILVTPVLTPGVNSVDGIFPGRGQVVWRDWYSHLPVSAAIGTNTTLSAPLGHINVHIRGGSALLLHQEPGYTTAETRAGPFELLVALDAKGHADGWAYLDDGISFPPGPSRTLKVWVSGGSLTLESRGEYEVGQKLRRVTILGAKANGRRPNAVRVQNHLLPGRRWSYDVDQESIIVTESNVDLNKDCTLSWD